MDTQPSSYVEHQCVDDIHGFRVCDATTGRVDSSNRNRLIWVGYGGYEGRWMKPEEALQLAAAIEATAWAHIEMVSAEQRRVFAINHPGEPLPPEAPVQKEQRNFAGSDLRRACFSNIEPWARYDWATDQGAQLDAHDHVPSGGMRVWEIADTVYLDGWVHRTGAL